MYELLFFAFLNVVLPIVLQLVRFYVGSWHEMHSKQDNILSFFNK